MNFEKELRLKFVENPIENLEFLIDLFSNYSKDIISIPVQIRFYIEQLKSILPLSYVEVKDHVHKMEKKVHQLDEKVRRSYVVRKLIYKETIIGRNLEILSNEFFKKSKESFSIFIKLFKEYNLIRKAYPHL